MEDEGFSLQDLTSLVRRRAAMVGLTLLSVVLLTLVVVFSLENLYKSTGTVIIDQQEVSDNFLPGTNQEIDRGQRIERIYDEVMTRSNLAAIVEKRGLYAEKRGDGTAKSVVSELRENFEMEMLFASDDPRSRDAGQVVGFTLSYYHPDPQTARDVTRDIVALFQEGNRQRRQAAYLETAAALERESDNLREQVSDLERQMAEFKSENPGALPEDRNFNRQVIERKARDLDSLDREIRSLQERKTLLQSQLAQTDLWINTIGPSGEALPTSSEALRNLQGEYLRLLGIYSPGHPDVVRIKREIDSLTGGTVSPAFRQAVVDETNTARLELIEARRLYGADHPDVRNLQRTVAALEQQIADMPAESHDLPPPNNPIYLNLEVQLNAVNNELSALRQDRVAVQEETEELDRKAQIAPEVERRHLELTRDIGLARKQYEDTKSRLMSVRRAGVLEEEELAERYVVTQYPNLPYKPAFPNKPLFLSIGVFLGLTFGLGAGIFSEALDGSIRSTRDIKTISGMPPIAAIPQICTIDDLDAARSSRIAHYAALGAIVIAVVVYVQLQRSGAI